LCIEHELRCGAYGATKRQGELQALSWWFDCVVWVCRLLLGGSENGLELCLELDVCSLEERNLLRMLLLLQCTALALWSSTTGWRDGVARYSLLFMLILRATHTLPLPSTT
jgi:hypothetical protein